MNINFWRCCCLFTCIIKRMFTPLKLVNMHVYASKCEVCYAVIGVHILTAVMNFYHSKSVVYGIRNWRNFREKFALFGSLRDVQRNARTHTLKSHRKMGFTTQLKDQDLTWNSQVLSEKSFQPNAKPISLLFFFTRLWVWIVGHFNENEVKIKRPLFLYTF